MLYLEDYLEMIENLPMEMRDRFTETRELDLQVQNLIDNLNDKERQFFRKLEVAGDTVRPEWKEEQFNKIKQEYSTALDFAEEKVQIVSQVSDLIERHLRKLDLELEKFKMELEADNPGITAILEKRSLELDTGDKQNGKLSENLLKKRKHSQATSISGSAGGITVQHDVKQNLNRGMSSTLYSSSSNDPRSSKSEVLTSLINSNSSYGSQGTAKAPFVAAAQKAIALTSETSTGRRTSSLKASYEGLVKGNVGISQSPPPNVVSTSVPSPGSFQRKPKKARTFGGKPMEGSLSLPTEWGGLDPNEPRYCLCNEVSHGEMVGCDNDHCSIEWFHYACVGLSTAPKGKWYCPQCTNLKRKGRKN